MEHAIQVLMTSIPGQRVEEGKEQEDGSILAFRKGGDECLFASWDADPVDGSDLDRGRGMIWIPVGEFSPEPTSIRPPEIVEEGESQESTDGSGTQERQIVEGPFGRGRGRSKRPEA